jgi:phospholipase/lecithinase/hemolysin
MLRKLSKIGAALLITALSPAPAGAFTALYSFGDSLSDVGNDFIASILEGKTPEPAPPYFLGEFSNGPNWVEDLSEKLGLGPVFPSLLGGNDYAYGGATTGAPLTNNSAVPNGIQQVATFLAAHGGSAPSTGLYTVWLGSNDVFSILASGVSGSTAQSEAQTAAGYEAWEIAALAVSGAKTFIVPLVPDLGKTPSVLVLSPAAEAAATSLASTYNTALESDLAGLAASLHGGLHFLDTFGLLDNAVANPGLYGLTDVTDPCYVAATGKVCATPNTYLFWDGVHPTAKVDAIIAADAALLLPAPFEDPASLDPPAPSPTPGAGLLSLTLLILIGLIRRAPEFLASRLATQPRLRQKLQAASPESAEHTSALHAARLKPRTSSAGSSQRTGLTRLSRARKSACEGGAVIAPAQSEGPGQSFHSTPA